MPEYTSDQLVGGIHNAIKAGAMDAVEAFLKILAVQDPHRAQDVMDTLKIGLLLAAEREG